MIYLICQVGIVSGGAGKTGAGNNDCGTFNKPGEKLTEGCVTKQGAIQD